tara:strand:- start:1174 stop:1929 length:756 start_codon:yes stop_codon:yes gene_type:complete
MTLHDALFPWATPRKLALFLSALAACLIFGDSTYGDVALAIDPVTLGLMYAGGKLIGGIGKAVQGYQAKKGVESIEGSEGFKTTQTLGKEAGERLKAGEYGDSAAGKRQQLGEIVRAQEGATRGSREQAKRSIQAQGGYGRSGRALAALRDVVTGGRAETVAKGAESIEKADVQRAATQRAADAAAHGTATAQRAQLETALASAKGQMYGGAMGAAGEPVSAYAQSQISAGAYEKKPGTTTQDEFLKLDRG